MNGLDILERAKEWAHLGAAEAISRAGAKSARATIEALTLFRTVNGDLADFSIDQSNAKRTDPRPVIEALDRAISS